MRTTLDLPDSLLEQVKQRAVHEGRTLMDVVADLLKKGLSMADFNQVAVTETIGVDPVTGLPLIECAHAPSSEDELTAERVVDILLDQEAGWHHGVS